jgi:sugar phosphate isomerase/epimerase
MKLGYSAWGMPNLSVDEQIEHIATIGYQGIEMISMERATTDAVRMDASERRRIRGLLDRSGLLLPSVHAPANPIDPDPEARASNIARIKAGVDLAVDLAGPEGAPCVVTMGYGKPEEYGDLRETLAERFRELADYAGARGVTLALETHVGQAIDLPEKAIWLLERVGHPNFRLNLDTSHFDVMGLSIEESVRPLVAYAVHTHVKDQLGIYPDHEFLTPGDGDYDYVTYLREMNAGGYRGFITSEISVMVQRKPGYDPVLEAKKTYQTMTRAFREAGLTIE